MKLHINENHKLSHIEPEVYGHFSEHLGRCIYGGLFVGENKEIANENGMRKDVVDALKAIQIPVLRWPGGNFADEYHWMDGIGPKELRKKMINTHWGGVIEDNSFGTHEYFELCRQLGCKTYVNGNVGSGTVREMSEWVEYMTFNGVSPMAELRKKNGHEEPWVVDYFGVGNENWGCGGNMTADYYGNKYRNYQTYVRNYDGNKPIKKVCCGPNADDYRWTKEILETCYRHPAPAGTHGFMDGFSVHYYVVVNSWEHKGSAKEFSKEEYYRAMRKAVYMDDIITGNDRILSQYDPEKKIAMLVDEWGCWHDVEENTNPGFLYQQNSMRDAQVAGATLNIFNKHSDRVKMGCLAQIVNVLQSVILTEDDKMVLTPTYHIFHMYRFHQDADLLDSYLEGDSKVGIGEDVASNVNESVSVDKDGVLTITLNNIDVDNSAEIEIDLREHDVKNVTGFELAGAMTDYNTFDKPETVKEVAFSDFSFEGKSVKVKMKPCSCVTLRVEMK
ncbi:alpha-N-arabinofuranosidase [Butyrivibrio proteoclasticus]|uniref:alpha-N-arabinofuranosidase n=1 Tax=Butyrivibrio proteoclasticus TaxID=43305 RepID=UPI0005566830|nr:alpha-L-arabinofuranosidase C-terminal domain-containing protein [Butyrivibrio proteoclasticus]